MQVKKSFETVFYPQFYVMLIDVEQQLHLIKTKELWSLKAHQGP